MLRSRRAPSGAGTKVTSGTKHLICLRSPIQQVASELDLSDPRHWSTTSFRHGLFQTVVRHCKKHAGSGFVFVSWRSCMIECASCSGRECYVLHMQLHVLHVMHKASGSLFCGTWHSLASIEEPAGPHCPVKGSAMLTCKTECLWLASHGIPTVACMHGSGLLEYLRLDVPTSGPVQ